MEGLAILIASFVGEILFVPLLAAMTVLLEGVFVVLGLVLELVGARVASRERPVAKPRRVPIEWAKFRRIGRIAGVSVLGLGAVGMLLAQFVLLEPIVRWAAGRSESVEFEFRAVSGNLFSGSLAFDDVVLRREDDQRGSFELTVERLEVDLAVLSALSSPTRLQLVRASGVRGSYEREIAVRRPKRAFVADRLELADVEIALRLVRKDREWDVPVVLDTWRSEPFRSEKAVFDALLRSTGSGRIADKPFSIQSRTIDGDGRETEWQIEELPVELAGAWLGGPLTVLRDGTADIDVVDRWVLGRDDRIDMSWKIVLRDVRAEVPDDMPRLTAAIAKPFAAFVNLAGAEIPLSFRVRLEDGEFDASSSTGAAELWRAVSMAAARGVADSAGVDLRNVEGAAKLGSELFKGWLNRRKDKK